MGGTSRTSYFNPRSPRGERHFLFFCSVPLTLISIHAPRGGSDSATIKSNIANSMISIHAPRGGSDKLRFILHRKNPNFNPRSPRGERPSAKHGFTKSFVISIHAPRGGSDCTVKACSNDRIKRSTLREPHFLYSKNACFSPIFPLCATTSRTKNHRIIVSFGSYPGLAPMCFTLDWYRFPRL